ncbi:DNA mismatch endonuclease Vsr [Leifsonia naganoensis]|uniref:DNA mismatch endonuclease Vsr n=1 Tax=Leifsonia naganoensis TaxID=150025 RepID=UPI0015CCCF76
MTVSWATSPAVRRSMLANRRTGTRPELLVRSRLHGAGYRFRVDYKAIPHARLRVDIAFTRQRVAVLIDGCFWHSCPTHSSTPKSNADYWVPKLAANVARDRRNTELLKDAGWDVLRFWEHEPIDSIMSEVTEHLRH